MVDGRIDVIYQIVYLLIERLDPFGDIQIAFNSAAWYMLLIRESFSISSALFLAVINLEDSTASISSFNSGSVSR